MLTFLSETTAFLSRPADPSTHTEARDSDGTTIAEILDGLLEDGAAAGNAFIIENGSSSPQAAASGDVTYVNLGGGWDPTSFEDTAGAEEIYFQKVEGAQPLHWMLEIEGVTQGAEAVFMFPENWAGPESFLQYAACQGALVIALEDGASPGSLILDLSIVLTGATEMPELVEGQAGAIQAIIAVELDAGSKVICAFPDVCLTPPENDTIDWQAPNGIIGILVGVMSDAAGSAWPDALVYADVWERSFEQITDDLTIEGPAAMGDLLL